MEGKEEQDKSLREFVVFHIFRLAFSYTFLLPAGLCLPCEFYKETILEPDFFWKLPHVNKKMHNTRC